MYGALFEKEHQIRIFNSRDKRLLKMEIDGEKKRMKYDNKRNNKTKYRKQGEGEERKVKSRKERRKEIWQKIKQKKDIKNSAANPVLHYLRLVTSARLQTCGRIKVMFKLGEAHTAQVKARLRKVQMVNS